MSQWKRPISLLVVPLSVLALVVVLAAVWAPEIPAAPPPLVETKAPKQLLKAEKRALEGVTLEQIQKQLVSKDASKRAAAAKRLMEGRAVDAPILHKWLHRRTKLTAGDYKNLLGHLGAHVPDSRGRFRRPPRIKDLDWLDTLLKTTRADLPAHLRPVLVETLTSVALMRSLARSGHPDAAVSLLRFGYRHGAAFKDECGRQIRVMGVQAVPGLLRARALRDPLAYKMVRYAAYQLDRIDCVRPDRALRKADPALRAEILHAYGEVRAPEAVQAVLRHTQDRSPTIRRVARWAFMRYVSGRPPRVVKRKLKLAGGKQTDRARALYYTYRQLAYHAVVDRLARKLQESEPAPLKQLKKSLREEGEPRYLAERLFRLLDQSSDEHRRKAVERAFSLAGSRKLEQALRQFDRLLAAEPFHPRREEMALHYFRRGRDLHRKGKHQKALALLTKAIHLSPTGEFVPEARLERDAAEAASEGSGTKRELHPNLAAASTVRGTHLTEIETSRLRGALVAAGVAGGLVLALLTGLVLLRRRLSL